MEFIKEESEDISITQTCGIKTEDTEEQRDLMELKEECQDLNEVEEKHQYQKPDHLKSEEQHFNCSQSGKNFSHKRSQRAKNSLTFHQSGKSFMDKGNLMEEKLILAVSSHPELYDSTSCFYRDRNKKDLAWKRVSEEIGQPEDFCRKKWKSLRDTYLKEKRKEMDKRSGSAAGSGKRWKYSQILGFLDPFVTPRETSGNMEGVEARIREDNHLEDQGQPGETAWETETEENDQRGEEDILRSLASSPVSPVPGPSAPAAELTGQQRRRARRRPRERSQDGLSEVEQTLLLLLTQPPARPPTPRSADEYFLLSLLPFLQSMPPHLKETVKFQIYKLAMENSTIVLNLEQLDPPTQ